METCVPDCGNGITVTERGSRKWGSPEALVICGEAPTLITPFRSDWSIRSGHGFGVVS